ncbi:MAG: gamma-glutamyltransferase family protein, partial [Alphaproteobacteria bacterium]|nr:gamma-glutamyltransferase family protein [Alphaproteobacteria bacterium]
GIVASTHWIASAVGFGVLERGGNAFDAAAATAFTLQVIEPHLNGPGGDAPIILYHAPTRRTVVVCGQGPAPKAAIIAKYRELGLDLVPGAGLLAAVVPGATDAWMHVLANYGTISLADALAPAIHYAENGFPVMPSIAGTIKSVRDLFTNEWKSSGAVWLANGEPPAAGSYHKNPSLAATYRRLIKEGQAGGGDRVKQIEGARKAWSDGFVAEAIDRFSRIPAMDSSGERHAGLLTGADMAGWRAWEEHPVTFDYGRYTLAKPGPWSQGPVLLQQLALLANFDLAAMDPLGPDFAHTVIECAKLAFADREAYYGDPNFISVPMAQLLAKARNADRRKLVTQVASLEDRPSVIDGFKIVPTPVTGMTAKIDVPTAAIGEPTVRKNGEARGDTVHLDVVDRHGNMVAATPSGGWLPSSPTVPELGFCLGSRAQMFWLQDGHPSALAPGKRPRATLSPSFAFKDGEPYMAFGTPGGDGQDQWPLIAFLRHVHHGMNLQEAIDSPVFHSEHFRNSFYPREARPGVVVAEGRLPKTTIEDLKRRGHTVSLEPDWSLSRMTAVTQDKGIFRGGASPRGMQGYAVGR